MIKNLFGCLAAIAMAGGGCAAYWYGNLSKADQAKADDMAAKLASELFQRTVGQLTSEKARHILELTRKHLAA